MGLLLNVTVDYKTSKAIENADWESCQSEYQDIFDKLLQQYPSPEEAAVMLDLWSRKTRAMKSYDNHDVAVFEKFRFQNVLRPH